MSYVLCYPISVYRTFWLHYFYTCLWVWNLQNCFNCPNKQCDSDPIPTWLVKSCASVLIPTITNIANLSLSSGQFHPILKEAVICTILKKSTLYNNQLSNYRPISNLSLISKIIERVVKSRLTADLCSNNLLNPHTSLPTVNITLLRQLYSTSMITS